MASDDENIMAEALDDAMRYHDMINRKSEQNRLYHESHKNDHTYKNQRREAVKKYANKPENKQRRQEYDRERYQKRKRMEKHQRIRDLLFELL